MSKLDEKKFCWKDFFLCILFCIIGVLICFVIWALARRTHEQFMLQFSFAATISSIILSVLAIFLSINGEGKVAEIRDEMKKETEDIRNANVELKVLLNQLSQKVDSVKSDTDVIKNAQINQSLQEAKAYTIPETNANGTAAKLFDDDKPEFNASVIPEEK